MQVQYKLAALMNDSTFQGGIRVLLAAAATNILGEAQGEMPDAEFNARKALCNRVIRSDYNVHQYLPQILGDSTIQAAVDAAAENLDAWREAVTSTDVTNRLGGIWSQIAQA